MKVICIDGAKKSDDFTVGGEYYPIENCIYEVSQHHYWDDCYDINEFPPSINGKRVGYRKIRFVPLSNIDEMELLEQRENNLVEVEH